jgi:hypothetical protein
MGDGGKYGNVKHVVHHPYEDAIGDHFENVEDKADYDKIGARGVDLIAEVEESGFTRCDYATLLGDNFRVVANCKKGQCPSKQFSPTNVVVLLICNVMIDSG